jgi:outer membrane protein OmpA-like peptidoglycan-associated protein
MKHLITLITLTLFLAACATSQDDPNRKTKQGAVTGAAAGAVVGGVIGNQSDNTETGAIVGAVAGAAIGAAIGRRMDQQQKELQQIEGVEVTRPAEDEIAVSVKNDILFDFNSSALRPEARRTINEMAEVFERYADTTITVEGHADAIGSEDYNQNLSEKRAGSVANYIISQGVGSSRVIARGYGETQPVATNETPEGRQLNRRVEIQIKANPEQSGS